MAAPAERIEPTLTFEGIEEVLDTVRRVAEEDYRNHLRAAIRASSEPERTAALEALRKSAEAATQADNAYKSAIGSYADFRASTVESIAGNEAAAASGFKRSGMGMERGAESLDHFASYAPQSKFFAAAMTTVQRLDKIAASVETTAQERVSAFARGLKAFAKGMSNFGKEVAATPAKVKEAVKEAAAGVATASATAAAIAGLAIRQQAGRIGTAVEGAVHKVEQGVVSRVNAVKQFDARVRESAWDKIDRFAKAATELRNEVANAVETKANLVERHAKATVGVAADVVGVIGGALRKLGADVAASYEAHSTRAAADQAARKGPVLTKSGEKILADYWGVGKQTLDKTNVVQLGVKPRARIVDADTLPAESPEANLKAMLRSGTIVNLGALLERDRVANVVFSYPMPGAQPLHVGAIEMAQSAPAVRLLLEAGASPNALANVDMAPPLASVMLTLPPVERAAAVSAMLEHGANPNEANGTWLTPLAAALTQGDIESTRAMLDAGAVVGAGEVAALLHSTQQKVQTSYTTVEVLTEHRAAEQLVKALFEADRSGVESALKHEKIAAQIERMPYMKDIIDRVAPEANKPRMAAQLG